MPEDKKIDIFEGDTIYLYYGTDHEIKIRKKKGFKQWIKDKLCYIKSFLH